MILFFINNNKKEDYVIIIIIIIIYEEEYKIIATILYNICYDVTLTTMCEHVRARGLKKILRVVKIIILVLKTTFIPNNIAGTRNDII